MYILEQYKDIIYTNIHIYIYKKRKKQQKINKSLTSFIMVNVLWTCEWEFFFLFFDFCCSNVEFLSFDVFSGSDGWYVERGRERKGGMKLQYAESWTWAKVNFFFALFVSLMFLILSATFLFLLELSLADTLLSPSCYPYCVYMAAENV